MGFNIEAKLCLKYDDENGTQTFFEGDSVICYIGKGFLIGRILEIGSCQENESQETAICIDTFKEKRTIKVNGITYLEKIPLDEIKPLTSVEEQDRRKFVKMFTESGYSKDEIEELYDNMKIVINRYNIPISDVMALAIYNMNGRYHLEEGKTEIDISGVMKECYSILVKLCKAVTNALVEAKIEG